MFSSSSRARRNASVKAAAVCVLLLAGSGCAYKADVEGGATARLRVVSTHVYDTQALVLKKDCAPLREAAFEFNTERLAFLPGRQRTRQHEPIGMPMTNLPEDASFSELRIRAGEPFSLVFRAMTGSIGRCARGLRFTPQVGADYEAWFAEERGNCGMEIRELADAGAGRALYGPTVASQSIPLCP